MPTNTSRCNVQDIKNQQIVCVFTDQIYRGILESPQWRWMETEDSDEI